MRPTLAVLAVALLGLAGCHNSCQRLCTRMADYADECGLEVTDDDLASCIDAQAGAASRDDRPACREYNDEDALREEWTCADLEDYWTQQSTQDTGRPDTGA